MNISQFLHFNEACPVCGKDLTLYMSVDGHGLWKANRVAPNVHRFHQHTSQGDEKYGADDYVQLYDFGAIHDMKFNSSKLGRESKTWQLFFFKLCGNDSINDNTMEYDINWYESCYFRSSPFYQFEHQTDKKWLLQVVNPDHKELLNRDESFVFKKMDSEKVEKVYLLNMDAETSITKFYYYTTTETQRNTESFEPNIFEKTDLPFLKTRPDFTVQNRERLLDRFDTWILLS